MSLKTQFHISAALCAAWTGSWLLYWLLARPRVNIGVMYAAISAGIFVLFFHVNPEYYLLPYFALVACLVVRDLTWNMLLTSGLIFSCAWIHNIAYVVCESKKILSCAGWVFPYGSLLLTNGAALLGTAILVLEIRRARGRLAPGFKA